MSDRLLSLYWRMAAHPETNTQTIAKKTVPKRIRECAPKNTGIRFTNGQAFLKFLAGVEGILRQS